MQNRPVERAVEVHKSFQKSKVELMEADLLI